MELGTLRLDIAGGIATVTLNRPHKNNAINQEMRYDVRALAEELYRNEAIRVVVVTGSQKAFSVGADIELFETEWDTPTFRRNTRILTDFFTDLEVLEKPVIAAIQGLCVGGGLELALACDIRFAGEGARFGLPENNIGLIPGVGGCSRLVKLVGLGKAKELIFSGEILTAAQAQALGLINRLSPDELVADQAYTFAERLLTRAPQALGLAKRVLGACVSADLATGRTIESLAQSILIRTNDHREGVRAFREKRRPEFTGG